jgi:5-enolpyruvylshikimate-3-phosphate synthase
LAGRRAALIDAGIMIPPEGDLRKLVDARLCELGGEPSRRGIASAFRHALTDAGRPRSSNPLILAEGSIVLRRGTALALLADRQLVLRIVRELTERPVDPRAVVALRNLLYPQSTGPLSVDGQQQQAHH